MARAKGTRPVPRQTPPVPGPAPAAPGPFAAWLARFGQTPAAYVAAAIAILIPCVWQSRLQAGDLSSHIYNAWLADLVRSGKTQGLEVVAQTTNVLFDLFLGALFHAVGAVAAQRIAVCLAVLIFASGAFAFVTAVSSARRWFLLPAIALLSYGWVFHMGFFNFYLSLGLCFWAMTLAWMGRVPSLAAAGVLLALAYAAHGLPVAWAVCLIGFIRFTREMDGRKRLRVTLVLLIAEVAASLMVSAMFTSSWSLAQLGVATGADQARVFDAKYYLVLAVLLCGWALLFLRFLRRDGTRAAISSLPCQIWLLTMVGIAVFPNGIQIPGFRHALTYISERMSLGLGVLFCAMIGSVRPSAFERRILLGTAALFFVFLYRDERALNALEDRIGQAVAQLPAGSRVIQGVGDPGVQSEFLVHMIDRQCLGRCYSYANYEASTWQFRIHAVAPNPVVAATYADSWLLQVGLYVVKPGDLPLWQVYAAPDGTITSRSLMAGTRCGMSYWKTLPDWLPKN